MSVAAIKRAARAISDGSGTGNIGLMPALVQEAVANLAWGAMTYECDACGYSMRVHLTLGVEGPTVVREAGIYVASPFTAGPCPAWPIRPDATPEERATLRHMGACSGTLVHVRWQEDTESDVYLLTDEQPRFVLDPFVNGARLVLTEDALVAARRYHADLDAGGTA